jgi:hypothetical protein
MRRSIFVSSRFCRFERFFGFFRKSRRPGSSWSSKFSNGLPGKETYIRNMNSVRHPTGGVHSVESRYRSLNGEQVLHLEVLSQQCCKTLSRAGERLNVFLQRVCESFHGFRFRQGQEILYKVAFVDEIHNAVAGPFDWARIIGRIMGCIPAVRSGKIKLVFA